MNAIPSSSSLARSLSRSVPQVFHHYPPASWLPCRRCLHGQQLHRSKSPSWRPRSKAATRRRSYMRDAADSPGFTSEVDSPPHIVRAGGEKHGWGLLLLVAIPVTSFLLGTWQVRRLKWKTALVARLEDNLARPALPLPPHVDPDAVEAFDYRRVWTRGRWNHDKEILLGPRVRDGENGFMVITPLIRDGCFDEQVDNGLQVTQKGGWTSWATSWWLGTSTEATAADAKSLSSSSPRSSDSGPLPMGKLEGKAEPILVTRGWISKAHAERRDRKEGLAAGVVMVEGLLRRPFKKNMFTPENVPQQGTWYFPDVKEMAEWAGTAPIWLEETMEPSAIESYHRTTHGIPLGREAAVDVRNNHLQYIVTWYSLSLATSFMFWLVVRKPPSAAASRVKLSRQCICVLASSPSSASSSWIVSIRFLFPFPCLVFFILDGGGIRISCTSSRAHPRGPFRRNLFEPYLFISVTTSLSSTVFLPACAA